MKKISRTIAGIAAFASLAAFSFAEDAHEIARKMLDLNVPDYSYATLLMDVIEADGKVEHRELKEYGGGDNGLKNAVFVFLSPASVKDTRILQAEKTNKEDDKWVYLPSLRTVRRLGAGDRSKSFVGSELTYNDMGQRKIDDDTHKMLAEDESVTVTSSGFGTVTYSTWKIEETPVKAKSRTVEYHHRHLWIDKATYLPVKIQTFDKTGKLLKTTVIEKIEKTSGVKGIYWLRKSVNVVNEQTGRKTHLVVKDYKFDEKIPPSYFTQQWLTTGKAK